MRLCVSEVSGASDDDEHGVLVRAEVEVCGAGCAPRLLPDLPLQHPAGRHVGNLRWDVMSLNRKKIEKIPASAFYYYREMTADVLECSRALGNVKEDAELLMTHGKRGSISFLLFYCFPFKWRRVIVIIK